MTRIIIFFLLFGTISVASAYNVTFRDANTAVIEVGDPEGMTRADGYYQIFGTGNINTFAPNGYDLSIMIYLSDATWSNWLDCYMDTQSSPNAESAIKAISATVNSTKGQSKIVIARQMDGSCQITLETATGNIHSFPYDGFSVDIYMSNFRVNMPVTFSAPEVGYYRYDDGTRQLDLFANELLGFHIHIRNDTGAVFQCQLSVGNPLLSFAAAVFKTGGSPVAEYNIYSGADSNDCENLGFRIGV